MGLNTINHPGQRLVTALTATGTTNLTAYPLVGGTAFHEFTTVDSGTGCILPSSPLPITVTVSNAGVETLSIYPPVGGIVDGGGVDSAATLTTGSSISYWAAGPLTWYPVVSAGAGTGSGTVTTISVVTAHGVSGSVANATTTPAVTLTLAAITPTTVVASGNITTTAGVYKVGANQVLGAQQPASVPVALTFTAGGTPTVYTTPTGALTIAHSDIPTVVELLAYCNELRGNVLQLQAILTAHGIST